MPGEEMLRRIKRFDRAIRRLRDLAGKDVEEILSSEDLIDVLENNMRIAIGSMLDVARYIIASMDWEKPDTYREAAVILRRRGVLNKEQSELLSSLIGLRNVIVHLYADIDYSVLVETLKLLDVMESIMGSMIRYARERGIDP